MLTVGGRTQGNPLKGVQGEDQRNWVQSGVQVSGGSGGPEGMGGEAQVARVYGVHLVTLANWKRHFLEHGAEVFGGEQALPAWLLPPMEYLASREFYA